MSEPFFSIVMRTVGNRDITLTRAIQSVVNQKFTNWELIIVVDNKDATAFEDVAYLVNYIDSDTSDIAVHYFYSEGHMECVSNYGLKQATGEYVCIHDDDDSWSPDFLEEVYKEIQESDQSFPAIMTHFNKIFEVIDVENNSVKELCRTNELTWLQSLQLGFVLAGNIFPPICLVYKREILDCIGMYDESLKVLGDWDFLIRLMYFTQIKVHKKPLANYHLRVNPSGIYGNSINTEGWSNLHIEYESYVRHKYQYIKVLLPNFEVKDIGDAIVNAKTSKTYWHWDYVQEVKKILCVKVDYKKNIESIVRKIREKYVGKQPRVFMYGAGKLFEELLEKGVMESLGNELNISGVIDSKFNGSRELTFSPDILKTDKDIDIVIVSLEYPQGALESIKNSASKDIDVYCIGSEY